MMPSMLMRSTTDATVAGVEAEWSVLGVSPVPLVLYSTLGRWFMPLAW